MHRQEIKSTVLLLIIRTHKCRTVRQELLQPRQAIRSSRTRRQAKLDAHLAQRLKIANPGFRGICRLDAAPASVSCAIWLVEAQDMRDVGALADERLDLV